MTKPLSVQQDIRLLDAKGVPWREISAPPGCVRGRPSRSMRRWRIARRSRPRALHARRGSTRMHRGSMRGSRRTVVCRASSGMPRGACMTGGRRDHRPDRVPLAHNLLRWRLVPMHTRTHEIITNSKRAAETEAQWTNPCRSHEPKQHAETIHFHLTKHTQINLGRQRRRNRRWVNIEKGTQPRQLETRRLPHSSPVRRDDRSAHFEVNSHLNSEQYSKVPFNTRI